MKLDIYRYEIWKLDADKKVKRKECIELGYNIYDAIYQFFRILGGQKLIMGEFDYQNNSVDFAILDEDGKKRFYRAIDIHEFEGEYDPEIHDWLDSFDEDFDQITY